MKPDTKRREQNWVPIKMDVVEFELHSREAHPFYEYTSCTPKGLLSMHLAPSGNVPYWQFNPAKPPAHDTKIYLMRQKETMLQHLPRMEKIKESLEIRRLLHSRSRHPQFEYYEFEGKNIEHYTRQLPAEDEGWVPNIDYGEDGLYVFDDDSYVDCYRRRKNWQDGPDTEVSFDIAEVTRLLHLSEEHPRYEYRTIEGSWDDIKSVNPPRKDNTDPNLLAPICFHDEHWERIYSLGDNPWHLNVDKNNGGYEVTRKGYKLWQRRPIQEMT